MTAEVSPRCQYSDLVVTVLVTLHEDSPKAAPNAVSAAMSTEMMILMICCLDIRFRFLILRARSFSLSLSEPLELRIRR